MDKSDIKLTDEQVELIEANKWDEEAVRAYISLGIGDDDLSDFEEAYQGEFKSDEDFAKDMADNTGSVDLKNQPWPQYCIDWEFAARELMMDYSELDGFYFRNL